MGGWRTAKTTTTTGQASDSRGRVAKPGKSQQGGGKGKQTAACDNPELTEEQVYPSVFLFAFLHASGQKADVQVPPVELDKMLSVVNGAPSLESVRVLKDAVFRKDPSWAPLRLVELRKGRLNG